MSATSTFGGLTSTSTTLPVVFGPPEVAGGGQSITNLPSRTLEPLAGSSSSSSASYSDVYFYVLVSLGGIFILASLLFTIMFKLRARKEEHSRRKVLKTDNDDIWINTDQVPDIEYAKESMEIGFCKSPLR
jgi:hypothetical protein